jgi:hypothetical protein
MRWAYAVALVAFWGCGGATSELADAGNGSGSGGGSGSSSGGSTSGGSSGSGSGSSTGSSGGSSGSSSGASSGSTSGSGSSSGSGSGSTSGSSSGSGSGSTSGGGSGSSSGGTGGPCPATWPSNGTSCSQDGLTCEYGSSPIQECDQTATCTSGSWNTPPPPPGPPGCDPSVPIMCPSSFSAVPQGKTCSPQGGYCDYPQGRCECDSNIGGLPTPTPVWNCQAPGGSCPMPRPRVGSACTQDTLNCDYGSCTIQGGTDETCTGGVWVMTPTLCAMAGGR